MLWARRPTVRRNACVQCPKASSNNARSVSLAKRLSRANISYLQVALQKVNIYYARHRLLLPLLWHADGAFENTEEGCCDAAAVMLLCTL